VQPKVTSAPASPAPASPASGSSASGSPAQGSSAQGSSALALVEVDAANLDYRLLGRIAQAEVRVGLARAEGGIAWFDYDHPPWSEAERVSSKDKAWVLAQILALHPGLAGVQSGDLRFVNRWRDWLRSAAAPR